MPFITDISTFLRDREQARVWPRASADVSIFGPELINHPATVDPVFPHPTSISPLPTSTRKGTIDNPRDTVAPRSRRRLIQAAVSGEATDLRPVHDSEHGPIHAFKDRHRILPEPFDDEYFGTCNGRISPAGARAAGCAGPPASPCADRWDAARAGCAGAVLPLIDWTSFKRAHIGRWTASIALALTVAATWSKPSLLLSRASAADKRLADREAKPVS
jgi:mannan endo-1,4-beta-mannosidase